MKVELLTSAASLQDMESFAALAALTPKPAFLIWVPSRI